ncbi:MAG: multidrug transporter [Micavibrio sp.]|nr:multidrug transporter [Micavibrio sp.]HCK32865.1 multidrug transporter [Rhodospirillaceae bacterium]
MRKSLASILVASTILSACTMIPSYERPQFSASTSWQNVPGYEMPVGETLASDLEWKKFFDSQELWLVIGTALQNNKDLRQTALSIEEARAAYRIERADLIPNINLGGSATYQKSSDAAAGTAVASKVELYNAGVGLSSYEVDLFGKIRSQNQSAINEYLATEEAHAALRNSLIAETANAYLQLLADQKLLALTEKTLDAQKETYDILNKSLERGVATEQDVARAATAVETANVNLHQYKRYVAQDKNALFMLMGIPQDDAFLPETNLDQISIKDTLKADLPSEVLLLRPDVRQAEYELLARNADIGAARAAFFPSITLTGNYGYASAGLSDLFTRGAEGAYSFVPNITLPIFQGGRNKANLDLAKIRKEKAIVSYEQAIQNAFRDVSDELAARATLDEQLAAQERLVAAAQKVYDLSQARYDAGVDSFLSVLDAQRELYSYEQSAIETQRQRLANLANLFKALGGGGQ